MNMATLPQLFSVSSLRLIVDLNCLEKTTQVPASRYHLLKDTQHEQGDVSSPLQSAQRALNIRLKLFRDQHSSTADSNHSLGVTQHEQGDFTSALQSIQRATDISVNLFGKQRSSAADSYHSLRVTQHEQGDLFSDLQFEQHVLNFRFKSLPTRGPGRRDKCHLTDFSQTVTDD